ncbi:lysophospholipid acyltransferase family protein [Leadbetterella sp. DM7]|uniref:lysophospholipid acyltransferase family protein n=1 Tax=Leadbetterella sp. DM7 TaxID=3235085 RepID=UPI00349E9D1A
MQAISFYLLYPFIWLFSLLPLRALYFISDFVVYPVLYSMLGYRKKVVRDNMRQVFPEKTEAERQAIERKFYHYLADLFMETIKGFSISYEELIQRVTFTNQDFFEKVYRENEGIVITLGHVGNYEWLAQCFPRIANVRMGVPYRKLTNPYFDKAFRASRERGGAILFHTKETLDFIKNEKSRYILVLANDQSAPAEKSYWVKFLNRDTSFFEGTEKMARQLNFPVLFAHIGVSGRGRYAISFQPVTDDPSKEPLGAILAEHARLLEQNIYQAPEYWLWSHKRWKHQKPAGFTYGFTRNILS